MGDIAHAEPSIGRGEWSVAAMFCVSVRGVPARLGYPIEADG